MSSARGRSDGQPRSATCRLQQAPSSASIRPACRIALARTSSASDCRATRDGINAAHARGRNAGKAITQSGQAERCPRWLNVTTGYLSQLERGVKHPTGPASRARGHARRLWLRLRCLVLDGAGAARALGSQASPHGQSKVHDSSNPFPRWEARKSAVAWAASRRGSRRTTICSGTRYQVRRHA